MFGSNKKRATSGRIPRVRILVGCMKDLNEFREADLVLVEIMREVNVLEESISDTAEVLAMPVW